MMVCGEWIRGAVRALALAAAAFGGNAAPVAAQGLFSPVLIVNDSLVTQYELDQRITFLGLLGAQNDIRSLAFDQLTVEALQLQTAVEAGFSPSPEAVAAGQAEFAARANLSREQFITALGQGGVDPATFRDFIAAGVAWRAYVQDRFRPRAEGFPEAALERAEETAQLEVGRRVLLSEILLPASTPQSAAISRSRAAEFSRITSVEAFAAAARQFSQAASRFEGGEVEWRLVNDLPPEIQSAVANLSPGRASRPVEIPNAIAVYYLRDDELTPRTDAAFASVDYQVLRLPQGARDEAARIAASVDDCDDIHPFAARYSPSALTRQTTLLSALPAGLSATVAGLDTGESGIATVGTGTPAVVTVCQRTFGQGAELDTNRLRLGIVNERLQLLAAQHLNDIRSRAVILRPQG